MSAQTRIRAELRECWRRLGIPERLLLERRLPLFDDAAELQLAETGPDGRTHRLTPAASRAWVELKAAATSDGIDVFIVSAYRSIARQIEILEQKLAAGQGIEAILAVSAPPGCSEHHTGRALDIGTPNSPPLEEEFERTPAYRWLQENADVFGFHLSYPRGNRWGYNYEPWHWCHRAPQQE